MSATALALSHDLPLCSEVSTTLPVSSGVAYEVFADVGETPSWLPMVQTARVVSRNAQGRPTKASFLARLARASIGYTLEYTYDTPGLVVSWCTPATSSVLVSGEARFVSLSTQACLMSYRLVMDLPLNPDFSHSLYDGHPASAVVADFREHLRRIS